MNVEYRRPEAEAIEVEARIAGLIGAAGTARSLSGYRVMRRSVWEGEAPAEPPRWET